VFKRHFITRALEANGWHQTRTARELSIQRSYLSKLVKELGITRERGA
jgi:Nif-specific regulatory protein